LFADGLAKHGLKPRMEEAYKGLEILPPPGRRAADAAA
jgi:hypothetical protein